MDQLAVDGGSASSTNEKMLSRLEEGSREEGSSPMAFASSERPPGMIRLFSGFVALPMASAYGWHKNMQTAGTRNIRKILSLTCEDSKSSLPLQVATRNRGQS